MTKKRRLAEKAGVDGSMAAAPKARLLRVRTNSPSGHWREQLSGQAVRANLSGSSVCPETDRRPLNVMGPGRVKTPTLDSGVENLSRGRTHLRSTFKVE